VFESGIAKTIGQSLKLAKKLNYPAVVRPAFTLGGTGGGIAYNEDELEIIAGRGLALSPVKQLLIEESVLGWLEFEFEVLRDEDDNAIIVCSMENLDPMGVHTGESIVVAPALTLPDTAYQKLRTSALKVVRGLGIVGGCNVQFAYNSKTEDYLLIEVNPRVSRSSALASKATGVPIARIASMLSIGHKLTNCLTE
jgi:carbamoyl-phosphate synthase large subunit